MFIRITGSHIADNGLIAFPQKHGQESRLASNIVSVRASVSKIFRMSMFFFISHIPRVSSSRLTPHSFTQFLSRGELTSESAN